METTPHLKACPAVDSHVDLIYHLTRHHPETCLEDLPPDAWVSLPRLMTGKVQVIVSAYYCMDLCNGPARSVENLRSLLEYGEKYLNGIEVIRTVEDLTSAWHGAGQPGAVLLLENADPLAEYPPEALKRRGFRIVGLTHAGRNRIGDGNGESSPEGLTSIGRNLVRTLEGLDFAIDTAHLSDPCFREVSDLFHGPLVSSHTGLRALCDTPRNLSDEQVEIIISRGGIIGIAAYPGMLSISGEADIACLFRQIDHIVQKYGPLGVGIGSDFGGYDSVCHGFEDHTGFPVLAEMLAEAGYPESAVQGILGGNWFRFLAGLLSR
jgi:membrane dipeptidase